MLINFSLDVKPVPQARPRFTAVKYGAKVYDLSSCKVFKDMIAWYAKKEAIKCGLKEPSKCPVIISITFYMGKPKNKKDKKSMYYVKKPDIDNLAKSVKDALKGVIYLDDCQIVEAHLYKVYGDYKISVQVRLLPEPLPYSPSAT